MRFIIIVKASKDSEAGVMPQEQLIAAMAQYHEELMQAGVLLDASGLQPSSKGWRIRYSGTKRTLTEGPFAPSDELIAGYTMIQVKTLEEAIEWTKRFPNPAGEGKEAEIEVRQLFELENFAPGAAIERFRAMDAGIKKRRIEPVIEGHKISLQSVQTFTPCLWFDDQAEEAARFYTSVFKNSKVVNIARYGEAGHEFHGRQAGTVMTVSFELDGQTFTALNGGPIFKFNEAISLQVNCETQQEVDYYWEKLTEGGDEKAQQCGWLKDKYGVSWQVVPAIMNEIFSGPETEKSERAMNAMLQMKKIDIKALQKAYAC